MACPSLPQEGVLQGKRVSLTEVVHMDDLSIRRVKAKRLNATSREDRGCRMSDNLSSSFEYLTHGSISLPQLGPRTSSVLWEVT